MLFTYNKHTNKINVNIETDFKYENIQERRDIEKWVEANPVILGEDLLIISTEYDKFDKTKERLDLLALDSEGNLVVIELKRDDSGKNVDLQAIKYAAYCSTLTYKEVVTLYSEYLSKEDKSVSEEIAKTKLDDFIENPDFFEISDKPRIIIVSKEFRSEVTASVLWLRDFGIDITCIKLKPYILDNNTIIFESTIIIPLPEAKDYLIKAEKKESNENNTSLIKQEYINFYTEIKLKLENIFNKQYPNPKPYSYYQIPTGRSGLHFEWGFHGRPRKSFGVELHFESGNIDFNKGSITVIKDSLLIINQIEQETNESVIFQEDWGKNWSRLYIEKNESLMTEELKEWAVKNMKIFIEKLQPEIDKLKSI